MRKSTGTLFLYWFVLYHGRMDTDEAFSQAVATVLRGERVMRRPPMSFDELAVKARMDKSTAMRLLNGKRTMDLRQLGRLCDAMELDMVVVMRDAESRVRRGDPS